MAEPEYTDLITGKPIEPWAQQMMDRQSTPAPAVGGEREAQAALIDSIISAYHTTRLSETSVSAHILSKSSVQQALAALSRSATSAVEEREDWKRERALIWRWIERAIYDDQIPVKDALSTLAHYPGAPWKEGRWDVDHKPYAEKLYADHPRARATS